MMQRVKQYTMFIMILVPMILLTACTDYSLPPLPPPTPTPLPPTPTALAGVAIPFKFVVVGSYSNFGSVDNILSDNSQLFIARDAQELEWVREQLSRAEAIDALDALNLDESVVVAIFRAPQPTSGYGVNITRILMDGNIAYVYAEFSQPVPGTGASDTVTHPYQIIKVPRAALPDEDIEWELIAYPVYAYPPWLD
jgi:hypothetical protein